MGADAHSDGGTGWGADVTASLVTNYAERLMERTLIKELVALAAICVTCGTATAGPVTAGEFPPGSDQESFDVFGTTNPPVHGAPFTLGNLTFSDIGPHEDQHAWIVHFPTTDRILSNSTTETHLRIDYGTPVEYAGLHVGYFGVATYLISFFDEALQLLGTVTDTNAPGGGAFFAGWHDAAGIKRIEILEISPDNSFATGIDNLLTFPPVAVEVPEPASLAVLGLGLLLLRAFTARSARQAGARTAGTRGDAAPT